MKVQDIIIICLVVLLCLTLFAVGNGGLSQNWITALLSGVTGSILATSFCLVVFWQIRPHEQDAILQKILDEVTRLPDSHFAIVGRNFDMGNKYWVNLIESLDEEEETVWFVGTRLSWWLRTGTYRKPLEEKLIGRLMKAAHNKRSFETRILLADSGAVDGWKTFINGIVVQVLSNMSSNNQTEQNMRGSIIIESIPKELSKYSLVLCGKRLAVTSYISSGRAEDCPTFDIRPDSVIMTLYRNDLNRIMESISVQRSKPL